MLKALNTPTGSIVVSVILGLGLAAIFRRACKGDRCIVIKGPMPADINKFVYKIEDDCYKYTPYAVHCPSETAASDDKA